MSETGLCETGPCVTGPVQIWRGGVPAWECDEMGHMNVRFYAARAVEGLAGLALHLGQPKAFGASATATLIVKSQDVRYHREALAGAPLHMTGGTVEMGESEAVLLQVLTHSDTGELCATFVTRVLHATPLDGRPFPWPDRARDAAARLRTTIPAFAALRGTEPQDPPTPSLERADALGMALTGVRTVPPDACDVFGRLGPDRLMGYVAEATGRMMAPMRRALAQAVAVKRVGGVALQHRMTYLELPRAGDHLEVRSGLASVGEKVQRVVHWLLDPASGRAWGAAEAVIANFDLDARKIISVPTSIMQIGESQMAVGV